MGLIDILAGILSVFDVKGEGYYECFSACLHNKLIDLAKEVEEISDSKCGYPSISFSWSDDEPIEDYPVNGKAFDRISYAFSYERYKDWLHSYDGNEKDYYDENHFALVNNISASGEDYCRVQELIRAYERLNKAAISNNYYKPLY